MRVEKPSTQNTVIIFLSSEVANYKTCYLYGDFLSHDSTKTFYNLRVSSCFSADGCFGIHGIKKHENGVKEAVGCPNWIHLESDGGVLSVTKLKIYGDFVDVKDYQFIVIYYDINAVYKSELLLSKMSESLEMDHFKTLIEKIQYSKRNDNAHLFSKCSQKFIHVLQYFVWSISLFSKNILPISKYSHVGIHFHNHINGFLWFIQTAKEKHKLNIKVMNFLLSTLIDMLIGILFLNWVTSQVSSNSFPKFFLLTAESVVNSLQGLLQWLTGNPGGLKLNHAFNKILATFFLFHIDIWWTFLDFLRPVLKAVFLTFLMIGQLGITYQASIIADLLAVISFHVYCIYAYAARLYNIQLSALISLWRLFLGRKKNPLRGKVDSCRYTPEQLFVGTVAFTILLFLLPTTLMYYTVFTLMRVLIITFGGILIRIQYLVHSLPIYSTFLWLFHSTKVTAGIQLLLNKASSTNGLLILFFRPTPRSWWETILNSQPDCVIRPEPFKFKDFLNRIVWGQIIYPV